MLLLLLYASPPHLGSSGGWVRIYVYTRSHEARKCDSSNRAQHGADGLIPIFPGLERGSCSCGRADAFLSYG